MNKEGHGEFRLLLFMLFFGVFTASYKLISNSIIRLMVVFVCFGIYWGLSKLADKKKSDGGNKLP